MDRILVLDGESRSALATVRSLGRLPVHLAVASSEPDAVAQHSRYATRRLVCPSAGRDPAGFVAWLEATVEAWKPHMLLPLTDVSLALALSREDALRRRTVLPCVDRETFARVSDKAALLADAAALGIATPRTLRIPAAARRTPEHLEALRAFPFPAALKTNATQSGVGGRFVRLPVAYPRSAAQALALLEAEGPLREVDALLQQRIEGPGAGVFALCADGRAVALFAHRRLLEKPPSGGISVLSESAPLAGAPVAEARALLERYRWQGVAMVEFKRHVDGRFYLMEINPRFWGSLQLAVDSGRDFPALLYRLFRSGDPLRGEKLERFVADLPPLRVGRRLRWGLGTLDHLLIRWKADPAGTARDVVFRNSLQLFRAFPQTRLEVLRAGDPGPFGAELRAWVRALRAG